MSRGSGIARLGLLSAALLLGLALSTEAQSPLSPAKKPTVVEKWQPPHQVLVRQIGFETQQQGYLSKIQGSASQNVQWVTIREQPGQASRRSWLNAWYGLLDLFD